MAAPTTYYGGFNAGKVAANAAPAFGVKPAAGTPKTYYGGWNAGTFAGNAAPAFGVPAPVENVTHTMVPASPGAPGAPGAPAPAPGTTAIDPRDAAYYQNVAANQFKVNNQINAAQLQESQVRTALQEALAQLAYQQPRSQLALEERANTQGGLYSSGYGQRQGDLLHGFATRQTAAQTNANNSVNRLTAQIAALQAGIPIYDHGQYLAAALRAAAAAAANPATGQPAAGGGSTTAKPPAKKGTTVSAGAGVPKGYSTPAQQMAASVAAAKKGGTGPAPPGLPASGSVITTGGKKYSVSYNAAGQIHYTPVG